MSMNDFFLWLVWAAAMEWLFHHVTDPLWWEVTQLVADLGGIPD